MAIIGTLPNILTNGTTADASQVMADLNYIVNQVNANATALGTLTAPAGTRIPMNQSSAPTGWTVDTSAALANCSMRLNSSTGGGQGGTANWSDWNFGGTFSLNSFTLSVAQLPAHGHTVIDGGHSHVDSGHAHAIPGGFYTGTAGSGNYAGGGTSFSLASNTSIGNAVIQSNTTGISIATTGSGASITPTITTPQVKFTDHIMAVKS
ncbi:hypothetical protein ACRS8P_29280 [Burkholderia cenocepacia]